MNPIFAQALQHHEAGRAGEALVAYRQLAAQPHPDDVLFPLYGMAALQSGLWDEAKNAFDEALRRNPVSVESHVGLGAVHQARDQLAAAIDSYAAAARIAPGHVEAWQNLGRLLSRAERHAEAIAAFQGLLALRPEDADALVSLSASCRVLGDFASAADCLRRAGAIAPEMPRLHFELGNLMLAVRKYAEAQACFERAIQFGPRIARYRSHLGLALEEQGQVEAALACHREAVELQPDQAALHNNMGRLLRKMGRLAEAEACMRRALALTPRPEEYFSNLAVVLTELGRHAEAAELFEQAVAARPDQHEAHMNLAQLKLRHGDFIGGWAHYEHRWWGGERPVTRREFPQPWWRGEPLAGRTILVWGEQGPGDEILYASMIGDLIDAGANLVIETESRLTPLFQRSFPAARVVARTDPAQPETRDAGIQHQIAMASLGQYLRRDFADFPRRSAWLAADPTRRAQLRSEYLAGGRNLLVGVSWRSKSKTYMAGKSSRLADWAPVLQVPGVTFVNLQYGDVAVDLAETEAETGVAIVHDTSIDPLKTMDDFAAQVAAMDLVISTSNTTVHVAGALGVPVWTLLPQAQGLLWYWFETRVDSPIYPSMTLYRQSRNGDWGPVLNRVAADLARRQRGICAA